MLHQEVQAENIYFDVSHKTQVTKGETILSIGEAFMDIQEIHAAIKCFEKARAIGKLQNSVRLVTLSEANIGLGYIKLGQYARGSARYRRAIDKHTRLGYPELSNVINLREHNNPTRVIE